MNNRKNSVLKLSALVLAMSMGLTGCQQTPVRNPFEKRAEPKLSELPVVKQTVGQADVAWTINGKEQNSLFNKLKPAVFNGVLYQAEEDGTVSAVNPNTGKEIWSVKRGLKITAGPSIIDNKLIIAARQFIVAFDLNDGSELWRQSLSSEVVSLPKGAGTTIVAHALDESITALSSQNGQILWQANHSTPALTLRTKSAPALAQDKVIAGLASGRVVALNLYSGMIEWEYTLATSRGRSELQRMVDISADPIIIDETAYIIGYQGKLAALNLEDGTLQWERNISSHQNMAHDQNTLYITDDEYHLWAVDRYTGTTIWKQDQLANRYVTNPSYFQNMLVVADRGGYIHWLNSQTGHLLGHAQTGEKFYSAPVAANDFLIVNSKNGKLSKITLNNLSQQVEG